MGLSIVCVLSFVLVIIYEMGIFFRELGIPYSSKLPPKTIFSILKTVTGTMSMLVLDHKGSVAVNRSPDIQMEFMYRYCLIYSHKKGSGIGFFFIIFRLSANRAYR